MKKLYTINTVNNFMEIIYNPFVKPFADREGLEVYNIMDDSLLSDTRKYNGMTKSIASRMLNYAKAAESSGAAGIIVTCTSVNEATKQIKPFLQIPILNIEEPVAEMAVRDGQKIGVLATIPTSPLAINRVIREKAGAMGKQVEIVSAVAEGAFEVLCAGDRAKHDEMVCEALAELAKQVDVIAFAQISMSQIAFEPVGVPVHMIGESGLMRLKAMMD